MYDTGEDCVMCKKKIDYNSNVINLIVGRKSMYIFIVFVILIIE